MKRIDPCDGFQRTVYLPYIIARGYSPSTCSIFHRLRADALLEAHDGIQIQRTMKPDYIINEKQCLSNHHSDLMIAKDMYFLANIEKTLHYAVA